MLERLITHEISSQILRHLLDRGIGKRAMIAVTSSSAEFIDRVMKARQSLSIEDISRLGSLVTLEPHELILSSLDPNTLPTELRPLYESTKTAVPGFPVNKPVVKRRAHKPRALPAA